MFETLDALEYGLIELVLHSFSLDTSFWAYGNLVSFDPTHTVSMGTKTCFKRVC